MLVPYSWLKDFVDIDISPKELGEKLVSCGFEIEKIEYLKDNIKNVVTARIESLTKHPNAEKLQIVDACIGSEHLTIVTAANNINVGDIVPLALDGAVLPSGKIITTGDLRGVTSFGMFCGGSELGLTEDDYTGASVNGILILDKDTPIGVDINTILGIDDVILDVAITANRPDCNSILGIAREVASVLKIPFKNPPFDYKTTNKSNLKLDIINKEHNLCQRYIGNIVDDIVIKESPAIIKHRLKLVGLRPINNIVDITNYVLTEIGQPMHAFDYHKIKGNTIVIRRAKDGESLLALDNKSYPLMSSNLVIANQDEPMAIAGIMGGNQHSIDSNTSAIVLESARFARDSIRHSSKQLNLRSDSSARYEKGVDYFCQEAGLNRALNIISTFNLGNIYSVNTDTFPNKPEKNIIRADYQTINQILGIRISPEIMLTILNNLAINTRLEGDILISEIPNFREDIVGVHDIAEEIIRIYGYDNITSTLMKGAETLRGGKTAQQKAKDKIKNILVGNGCSEIISYSFYSPKMFDLLQLTADNSLRKVISIANPIGEDFSIMRTTLAPSMIKTLSTNFVRGNKAVRLFELGKIYLSDKLPLIEYPIEKTILSLGIFGENEDFYTIKSIVEDIAETLSIPISFRPIYKEYMHPTRTAEIYNPNNGYIIGYIGEVKDTVLDNFDIDKRAYLAEMDAQYLIENTVTQRPYEALPKYPCMERDIAILVEEDVSAQSIISNIKNNAILLEQIEIFDIYTGGQIPNGYKSVAVKLVFRDKDKTMRDDETNKIITNILEKLEKELGAKLR